MAEFTLTSDRTLTAIDPNLGTQFENSVTRLVFNLPSSLAGVALSASQVYLVLEDYPLIKLNRYSGTVYDVYLADRFTQKAGTLAVQVLYSSQNGNKEARSEIAYGLMRRSQGLGDEPASFHPTVIQEVNRIVEEEGINLETAKRYAEYAEEQANRSEVEADRARNNADEAYDWSQISKGWAETSKEWAEKSEAEADRAAAEADEAMEAADRADEARRRQPIIKEGNWWIWNPVTRQYEDSGQTSKGNLIYATFAIDPDTGILYMYNPDDYHGPKFRITDGLLEVVVSA